MDKLISVILPTYNNGDMIGECIDSVLCQTYENFELIIVNDGSTDNTQSVTGEYSKRDGRVRVINKENGGVSSARNRGLSEAKGEYIAFVDGDDILSPRYLERLIYALNEEKCRMSVAAIKKVNDISSAKEKAIKAVLPGTPCTVDIARYSDVVKYNSVYCFSALYERELLDGIVFDSELHYGEDSLFFLTAFKKAGKYAYIDEPLYFYVDNINSATHKPYTMKRYDEIIMWERVNKMYEEFGDPVKTAIEQKTITVYMHFYYSLLESGNATGEIHRNFRAAVTKRRRAVKNFMKDKNVSFWKGRAKMAAFLLPAGLFDFFIGARYPKGNQNF